MKKEELLKFEIDQLRKDKMIYALESIALTFIVEVSYFLLTILNGETYSRDLAKIFLIIPLIYFIYMIAGNTLRLIKIKKLERELFGK